MSTGFGAVIARSLRDDERSEDRGHVLRVWRREAEIERQLAYSVPSIVTTSVTQCLPDSTYSGLTAFAMNRRQLRRGAFVQIPASDYLLPALLTTRKIAVHFNGRPVVEWPDVPRQRRRVAVANRDRGPRSRSPARFRCAAARCAGVSARYAFAKNSVTGLLENLKEVLGHAAAEAVRFRARRIVHRVTLLVRSRGLDRVPTVGDKRGDAERHHCIERIDQRSPAISRGNIRYCTQRHLLASVGARSQPCPP